MRLVGLGMRLVGLGMGPEYEASWSGYEGWV